MNYTAAKRLFILDANILIDANNTYYAQDLCAEFWRQLADCSRHGTVISIDMVCDEITRAQTSCLNGFT